MAAAPALIPQENLAQELRAIHLFEDLPEETIQWLVEHMEQRSYAAGELILAEGSRADRMSVIFEGEIRGRQEHGSSDGRVFTSRAGMVTGLLPFSRLEIYPLSVRAVLPTRVGFISKDHFPEMIATLPTLVTRLVGVMSDRIRESTVEQQQRDKLISLGRLSAGLAHELNNPAAAAQRSTEALRDAIRDARQAHRRLQERDLTPQQRQYLASLESDWNPERCPGRELTSIERCDLEDTFGEWLSEHGVDNAWMLAPSLAEAACDIMLLDQLAANIQGSALGDALAKLAASFAITRLTDEIDTATRRISALVKAVKEYFYMDQAPEQEVDIHRSLDSTLQMMEHRLENGIEVRREYDLSVPVICAFGSELNQVWTNLIDNAIDAIENSAEPRKGVLVIHTSRTSTHIRVEICDNGVGIPENIRGRIFDPFFTTKRVGDGTGLGLDNVFRIVKKHSGRVEFDSKPGDTRFSVELPLKRSGVATMEPIAQLHEDV